LSPGTPPLSPLSDDQEEDIETTLSPEPIPMDNMDNMDNTSGLAPLSFPTPPLSLPSAAFALKLLAKTIKRWYEQCNAQVESKVRRRFDFFVSYVNICQPSLSSACTLQSLVPSSCLTLLATLV
jgi:hypothetical protein